MDQARAQPFSEGAARADRRNVQRGPDQGGCGVTFEGTVTVTARNGTSDGCLDRVVVRLDEPLGDRQLVDGATGQVVAVVR
jgi:hypothetical protein